MANLHLGWNQLKGIQDTYLFLRPPDVSAYDRHLERVTTLANSPADHSQANLSG